MPKLPEFTTKPINGELTDGGIRTTMNIEKLKYALEKWTGKKHKESSKKKMSNKKKGKIAFACTDPATRAKAAKTKSKGLKAYTYPDLKVVGTYLNTREAGEDLNMHPNMIAGVARGVHKSVRGFTFKYIKNA